MAGGRKSFLELGTGYRTREFVASMRTDGRGGVALDEAWAGERRVPVA